VGDGMTKFTDLGFMKGTICETIVSTYNTDGTPNAAPMGTIIEDEQNISLNIYNSSSTNSNLNDKRCAVINLTSNVEFFYKTAFKETNPHGKLPQEWFAKTETINAPKLQLADAAIEVLVVEVVPVNSEKTKFTCTVKQINAEKIFPQVYCRAMALTLEAIVHATRVKVFINDTQKQEYVSKLLALIQDHDEMVNRVAPNSKYSLITADIIKRTNSWRIKL
jgi:hypothetical protein